MKILWTSIWFLLFYSLGALVLVFPGEYTSFKWSLTGFIVFYGLILWYREGWKLPWRSNSKDLFSHVLNVFLMGSIFSLVAYFSYQRSWTFDLTSQEINKVSESTKQTLGKINKPFKVTVLAEKKNWQQINDFFQFFLPEQRNIKIELFSPAQKTALLQSLSIKKIPAYIYEYEKQKRVGYHLNEGEFVKKVNSLMGVKPKTLCWLEGFSGVNLHETGRNGASYLKNLMLQEGHRVLTTNKPLNDCDTYLSMGFQSQKEEDVLRLKKFIGKKPILFAFDPDLKKKRPQSFSEVLKEGGIEINNNVVIDRESMKTTGQAVNLSFSTSGQGHQVFQGLSNPLMLPLSTSFKVAEKVEKILMTPDFPKSWGETDLSSLVETGEVSFSPTDTRGPIPIFVESSIKGQKLYVLGTSLFVTNAYKAYSENFHFFLNILSNLLGEDILKDRSQIKSESLQFTQSQLNLVTYLCLIVTPLSFLLIAFYCFRRRVRQ